MKLSLQGQLTTSFVGFAVLIVTATLVLSRWTFVAALDDYISGLEHNRLQVVARRVGELYARGDGWPDDIAERFGRVGRLAEPPPPPMPSALPRRPRPKTVGPQPTALFDGQDHFIAGNHLDDGAKRISVPVVVDGQVVGHIRSTPRRKGGAPLERAFSRRQLESSLAVGLAALLLAIVVAALLARWLLAPIRRVLAGVSRLSQGEYDVKLDEPRQDELGELSADFDALAQTLGQSRQARQRLFADISHELRTPLAVLTAEIEALADGVRTFDEASLDSLAEEVSRLRRLVDDLHELSTSDLGALHYKFEPCDVRDCLEETLAKLPPTPLEVTTSRLDPAVLEADGRRLEQLFRNLLLNALAYTDAPGRVDVELTARADAVELVVRDTAPSVPEADCERLFEPLYRVEASRSRRTAGSGLGLAISRRIVEAHGGTITAKPSAMGGLEVTVTLPK